MEPTQQRTWSIQIHSEGYVKLKHNRSDNLILTTRSKEQAFEARDKLDTIMDWSKEEKVLEKMYEQSEDQYKSAYEVIKDFQIAEQPINFNYLETYNAKRQTVLYAILDDSGDKKHVRGTYLGLGVASHHEKSGWTIDHIPSGTVVTHGMHTLEQVETIISIIDHYDLVNWEDKNALENLIKNEPLKEYLKLLKNSLLDGKNPPKPTVNLVLNNAPEFGGTNSTQKPEPSPKIQDKVDKPKKNKKADIDIDSTNINTDSEETERQEILDSALKQLEGMVGLRPIKTEVKELIGRLRGLKKIQKSGNVTPPQESLHSIFTGNPGTGKTVVARIMADIYYGLGYIPERKCHEVSAADLVSGYNNMSATETRKHLDLAMGGVFFIDEAYALRNGKNGIETITELVNEVEKRKNDFVLIMAGYGTDMDEMLNENIGFSSRIPNRFHFPDYTPNEVKGIIIKSLESYGYDCSNVNKAIEVALRTKTKNGVVDGNARTARNLSEAINKQFLIRIDKEADENIVPVLVEEDIKYATKKNNQTDEEGLELIKKEALENLNTMIGLNNLKEKVRNTLYYLQAEEMKLESGLTTQKPSMHMLFMGPPGTGKTTVARIVGRLFKGAGLLTNGTFTEAGRADLVEEYQGHTAKNVKRVVQQSLGGILFIDEAYSLVQNERDTFGIEAIDTLVAEMENNKDDLLVIFGGYKEQIHKLFESNPGLPQRFRTHLEFPHYSKDELLELLMLEMKSNNLVPTEEAITFFEEELMKLMEGEGYIDGDGRWIRNMVDNVKMTQGVRIVTSGEKEDLTSVTIEDMQQALLERSA